jgi:hypothetical protein
MNDNEFNAVVDLIYNKLHCNTNANKSIKEQKEMIKTVLVDFYNDCRKIGRNQILNHLQNEINELR